MHELGLALEVCRMTEERLGADGIAQVREVGVEIGDDAGIEVGNFQFCLETLLAEPPFQGARPVILRRPGDVLRLAYLEVDDGRPDD
jgi:Zn finger protein HypA/HybF involved in hydrogenase expression